MRRYSGLCFSGRIHIPRCAVCEPLFPFAKSVASTHRPKPIIGIDSLRGKREWILQRTVHAVSQRHGPSTSVSILHATNPRRCGQRDSISGISTPTDTGVVQTTIFPGVEMLLDLTEDVGQTLYYSTHERMESLQFAHFLRKGQIGVDAGRTSDSTRSSCRGLLGRLELYMHLSRSLMYIGG